MKIFKIQNTVPWLVAVICGIVGIVTYAFAATTISTNIVTEGNLTVSGAINASSTLATGGNITVPAGYAFDTSGSGILNIGTATATTINIGRAGQVAAFLGNTTVAGSITTGNTVIDSTAGVLVPVIVSTSGPVAVTVTGFYFNNASGAITYNLPSITSGTIGMQFCFNNAVTRSGVITLQAPASTYIGETGVNGSAAGTFVSGGAVGDSVCAVAVSTTQYIAYIQSGTWTNN